MNDAPVRISGPLPPSTVRQGVVWAGLACLGTTLLLVLAWPPENRTLALALLLFSFALPMLALQSYLDRNELFPAGSVARARTNAQWDRVGIKLIGLAATFAIVATIYWAFPIYRDGQAVIVWSLVQLVGLPFLLITPVYVWFTDAMMQEPEDGLYTAGLAVLGRWSGVDRDKLTQYVLGWMVKAFFAPLMLWFTIEDLNWLLSISPISMITQPPYGWYQFGYKFFFLIDLLCGDVGYLCTLRLFNTHIRSTDRTPLGWAVCLVCYPPFWLMIRREYLSYWEMDWAGWFGNYTFAGNAWAALIVLLTACIIWSDVAFGLKFSNLSYRGIVTNGPFAWTKHPGYLAKNVHWWLISVPFLSQVSAVEALRHSLLLACVNAIYFGRAKTEEWHLLSVDQRYRAYSDHIDCHGLVARVKRALRIRAAQNL